MHTSKTRPASHSEMLGGEMATDFFLWEEEGLEPVQTLVPIAANARKPKMTNAAPRIFLQEGRFAVVRCAIHQGHQCGQSSLVQLRLLLTQHSFALTAGDALRCGSCRQTGHLQTWFRAEPIMYFRCGRDRHERRGLSGLLLARLLRMQHILAVAASFYYKAACRVEEAVRYYTFGGSFKPIIDDGLTQKSG